MKKKFLNLFLVLLFGFYKSIACDVYVPEITGSSIIQLNNTYQYTLSMSPEYKAQFSYTNTQWSFQGLGVVGYGETFSLNTAGWTIPEGIYTLTANVEANNSGCYGCFPQGIITKQVEFRRPRPDLVIESFDYPSSLPQNSQTTAKLVIKNNGNGNAPASFNVYYEWSKTLTGGIIYVTNQTTQQLNFGFETVPSGTMTDLFFPINTPSVQNTAGTSETWTLKIELNPGSTVKETNYTNNSTTYSRTIYIPSSIQNLPSDNNYSTLISVENSFGKNIWKKGENPIDFSQLKGFHIFKFEENGMIRTQKIVNH